jgi:hypothetical protein
MLMSAANRFEADDASEGGDYFAVNTYPAGDSDFCSRDGAQVLKARIEAYWRERGHTVLVALHNVGFHPAIRAARFDVRSDMVNGMPRNAESAKRGARLLADAFAKDFDVSDEDAVFE